MNTILQSEHFPQYEIDRLKFAKDFQKSTASPYCVALISCHLQTFTILNAQQKATIASEHSYNDQHIFNTIQIFS